MKNPTGERLETSVYSEVTIEHLHRYAIAMRYANSQTVLDIACGEGYWSNLMASIAKKVIGVDISEETIHLAKEKYDRDNIDFICGSTSNIPLPDDYCDVIVSFETIEHHDEHEKMMQEIKRVLKKDGLLIISTPDKKYYSDLKNYKNPFHVKELYYEEFKTLISKYFINAHYFFQNNIVGSLIIPEDSKQNSVRFYSGNYLHIHEDNFQPLYNVCIASNTNLPAKEMSFFDAYHMQKILFESRTRNTVNAKIKEIKSVFDNSWSYRIGRLITLPVRLLRKSK